MEKINNVGYQQIIRKAQAKVEAKQPEGKKDAFSNTLDQQLSRNVKFSKHAMERLSSRGINLDKQQVRDLEKAVDKASGKGIKDSVVMFKDTAFIVSVRNKTVVTAMHKQNLKQNVITNVDGVVMM